MVNLAKKPFRWKPWIVRALLAAAVLAVVVTYLPGAYRRWQVGRLAGAAQSHMKEGRTADALVLAQRVLELDPANPAAFRILADAAEAEGNPSALEWRERLYRMNPGVLEDLIAYARVALIYRNGSVAGRVLASADDAMTERPEYLELAGDVALRFNDREKAEENYTRALAADPKNGRYQLKLAVAKVQGKDEASAREGLATLEELAKTEALRLDALRALVRGFAALREWDRSTEYAARLIAEPGAGFGDRLLHLSALREIRHPDFAANLRRLQEQATEDVAAAGMLVSWMLNHRMAGEAIGWAEALPKEMVAHPALGIALCRCMIAARDWNGLQEVLKRAQWGALDHFRFLFLARLNREKGDAFVYRQFWESALGAARRDPQNLMELGQIAEAWKWDDAREEFLWAAAELPELRWAVPELERMLPKHRDARKLRRLMHRKTELNPADRAAQNNLAMLDLLLGAPVAGPLQSAEKLHREEPGNAAFTSTLAFALLQSHRAAEALAKIESIPAETLQNPAYAGFYGLILEANGRAAEAEKNLLAGKTVARLDEETALLDEAIARIRSQKRD